MVLAIKLHPSRITGVENLLIHGGSMNLKISSRHSLKLSKPFLNSRTKCCRQNRKTYNIKIKYRNS